jgi:anti-sigma regulatory factor (Ser/Thr protein kinase)
MDVRLDAYPGALRLARKIAATAALTAGATRMAAFELETALGEALTNAFLHAYGGDPRRRIVVHFDFADGGLRVTVRDGGRALQAVPTIPAAVTPGVEGGRGLFLMSKLMDRVEVIHPDRRGRGTAIRMTKRLSPH